MNKNDPYAISGDMVTAAVNAFGTATPEQRTVALAALLLEAGLFTELQLRVMVFRVSGPTPGR